MIGYRALLHGRSEMQGTISPATATLAQQAAHQRDTARYELCYAHDRIILTYRELDRYPDARFRSLRTNATARHYLAQARSALRMMRQSLYQARVLDAAAAAAEATAA